MHSGVIVLLWLGIPYAVLLLRSYFAGGEERRQWHPNLKLLLVICAVLMGVCSA